MSHPQFINGHNGQVFMITAPLMPNAPLPISATAGSLPLAGPSTPRGSITPGQHHLSPQQYSPQQYQQFSQHFYHQFQQQQHQQQQRFQLQLQTTGQLVQQQIQHQQQQHQQQQQQQQHQQLQISKQKHVQNHLPKQPQPIINNNQQQSAPKPTKHQATQSKTPINIKEKCINHYIDGQIIIESLRPLSEKKAKKKKKQKLEKEQDQEHVKLKERVEINKKEPERVEQPKVSRIEIQRPEQPRAAPAPIPEDNSNNTRKTRDDMATWSTTDVKKFIEGHKEISVYAPKFADEEIDGPALLQLIDKNSFQILTSMFKHGPAIKIEAVLSNYKLNE